jgi:hypothetical protein
MRASAVPLALIARGRFRWKNAVGYGGVEGVLAPSEVGFPTGGHFHDNHLFQKFVKSFLALTTNSLERVITYYHTSSEKSTVMVDFLG